ncbi:PE-PPE domain-containing protein [Mycolicibacter icosiumassiliensis]|uniref:PE-PPE domain-containing protein n=1 Tax=Mycolicibacter icosiumassiliensis TaxID=1792835 RepID=UPI0008369A35|nr:PE-PPE domain-containing protein [Mycolicibacter icosiumassiliensis]
MTDRRLLPLAVAPLLIGAIFPPASIAAQGSKSVSAQVVLLDSEGWGMGGSGTPIPSQALIDAISARYIMPASPIFPGQPIFPVDSVHPLFTPEGLYPMTGVKSLVLDQSVAQGVQILDATIKDRLALGHDLVVVGGSQSSTIASLEMRNLLALPADQIPTADQLSFVLLVDPSNPNGGLLSRFGDPSLPPLSFPSMGVTFSGATPSDTPWHTAIYNMEYDGFSDFPRYPLNFLADLNAVLGIAFVHGSITGLSDEQIAQSVLLPVSDGYAGNTDYFMIPTENLPLLELLRAVPILGDPLADLMQPALRVLINLGYGNIEHGWDQGPADLSTPFGLFPNVGLGDVFTALGNGVQQGWQDFIHDLGSLPSLPDALANSAAVLGDFTDGVNAFSADLSTLYSTLLPITDLVNALFTTLPAYDVSLFAQELASGDLLNAALMPIAADMGLATAGIGIGVLSVLSALMSL